MKEPKDERRPDRTGLSGIYGAGTEFEGKLRFRGSFRIDGYFKGTIESDATLIVGERGNVEADIRVGHAVIDGEVRGRIRCDRKIEVHGHGRVFGAIVAPRMAIAESAYIQAECRTEDSAAPNPGDAGRIGK